MLADTLISPPLTAKSPLGSLSGWEFILHCPRCGERRMAVDKIAKKPAIYAKPLAEVLEKFSCSGCGARPAILEAECVWARKSLPPRTRINLTRFLPGGKLEPPAPAQQLLFG